MRTVTLTYPLALLTAFAAFILIIAGGLVTSTGSGLAVPDWPLSYGTLFPPMVGGIRFEHTHRMIAAAVGLLTLILALWLILKEPRRSVRRLGIFALGLVVLQGILGGLTVLWQLPLPVSVAHACMGQTFFATIVLLAAVLSPGWNSHTLRTPNSQLRTHSLLPGLAILTTLAIYGQLILGALLRHTGSGLIYHLIGAAVVAACIFALAKTSLPHVTPACLPARQAKAGVLFASDSPLRGNDRGLIASPRYTRLAMTLVGLLPLQLLLGGLTVFTGKAVLAATAHVAVGALLLAASVLLTAHLAHPFMLSSSKHIRPSTSSGRTEPLELLTRVMQNRHSSKGVGSTWHLEGGLFARVVLLIRRCRPYLELTKPRLTAMAVATTGMGFLLGAGGPAAGGKLAAALLGTALVGGGAGALNQVMEDKEDARMQRTCRRPIPSGRVGKESALAFGVSISVAGLLLLAWGANPLAAALAAASLSSYLFLYTPLKRRTALCTLVGAIPGAIPPLIGWAAARASLGLEAWLLFFLLFLWQLPHFLAIAWNHRGDYARAGFKMLPVLDPQGGSTGRQIVLYCLALLPVSLLPTFLGLAGWIYFLGAFCSSGAFLMTGLAAAWVPSGKSAQRLFFASLLYLPVLFIMMTLDRVIL